MFRISQRGEYVDNAETIDHIKQIVKNRPPGHYAIDRLDATFNDWLAWGLMIMHPDGSIEEDPWRHRLPCGA